MKITVKSHAYQSGAFRVVNWAPVSRVSYALIDPKTSDFMLRLTSWIVSVYPTEQDQILESIQNQSSIYISPKAHSTKAHLNGREHSSYLNDPHPKLPFPQCPSRWFHDVLSGSYPAPRLPIPSLLYPKINCPFDFYRVLMGLSFPVPLPRREE